MLNCEEGLLLRVGEYRDACILEMLPNDGTRNVTKVFAGCGVASLASLVGGNCRVGGTQSIFNRYAINVSRKRVAKDGTISKCMGGDKGNNGSKDYPAHPQPPSAGEGAGWPSDALGIVSLRFLRTQCFQESADRAA